MYKKYFKLDLGQFEENPVFSIQYDQECSRMEIRVLADEEPLDLSGCYVKVRANQPNGKSVFKQYGIVTNKKGRVYLDLVKHLESFDVRLPCELKLYGPDELLRVSSQFYLIVTSPLDVDLRNSGEEETVFNYQFASNVRLIAHRGLSALAPENTLPAYHLAGKYGYWGAECDIHETADGEFILMHDELLNRMSNGSGNPKNYTVAELKKLVINQGNFIECYPKLKIPTLSEFLQVCKIHGVVPVIEIKQINPDSINRLLKRIEQWGGLKQVVIITFHKEVATEVRIKNKEILIQWLADLNRENINYCAKYGMAIDVPRKTLSKELIEYAHSRGVLVNTWTVDHGEDLCKYMRMGVDFISTNVLLHQHSLNSSGLCKTYRLNAKKDYEYYLHESLSECKDDQLPLQSFRWHEVGQIMEMKGDVPSVELIEINLPKLQAGDVITISFHYRNISGSQVKAGIQYVEPSGAVTLERSIKTTEQDDWGYIEHQFIVLHQVSGDREYYKALIGNWSLSSSHFMLRHVAVKVDFM